MGLGIPPLRIKTMFESNPPKSTMLVGGLAVLNTYHVIYPSVCPHCRSHTDPADALLEPISPPIHKSKKVQFPAGTTPHYQFNVGTNSPKLISSIYCSLTAAFTTSLLFTAQQQYSMCWHPCYVCSLVSLC